jgi:hypothetical protein
MNMSALPALETLGSARFETAGRAEGRGGVHAQSGHPDQHPGLQEAKDSSEIENIVTTHDELFRDAAWTPSYRQPAAKEVRHYIQALRVGFGRCADRPAHHQPHARDPGRAGAEPRRLRKLPGTVLKNSAGMSSTPRRIDPKRIVA